MQPRVTENYTETQPGRHAWPFSFPIKQHGCGRNDLTGQPRFGKSTMRRIKMKNVLVVSVALLLASAACAQNNQEVRGGRMPGVITASGLPGCSARMPRLPTAKP